MQDLFSLSNKVIIITGGAGLLGRKHAEAVAAFGGIPVILDLDDQQIQEFVSDLNHNHDCNAYGLAVDITKEEAIKKATTLVLDKYGQIDGLVNNAANNPKVEPGTKVNFSRLENFPLSDWQADIAVGLTGAFLCAKYFGYEIAKNPNGGAIVNISSDLGIIAPDQRLYQKEGLAAEQQPVKPVTYSVVKAGLIGLNRYLSTYWPDKVRANAICPGGVENNQNEQFLKDVTSRIPMGRMANTDEYQGLLIFLLSSASSYLNGAVIAADGGRSAW